MTYSLGRAMTLIFFNWTYEKLRIEQVTKCLWNSLSGSVWNPTLNVSLGVWMNLDTIEFIIVIMSIISIHFI